MARTPKKAQPGQIDEPASKRGYLKQSDVPAASLDEALRVAGAILEHYAAKPTAPLYVAKALNIDPQGRQLKLLTGASIAFGLTEGGAQAEAITVTDAAKRILRPTEEGEDLAERREAMLRPRVFGEFLRAYDGHPLPRRDIAVNVLEEMGVPRDKADEVFERIVSSAESVGYLEEIKDKLYVSLQPSGATPSITGTKPGDDQGQGLEPQAVEEPPTPPLGAEPAPVAKLPARSPAGSELAMAIVDDERRRRVFITSWEEQGDRRAHTPPS